MSERAAPLASGERPLTPEPPEVAIGYRWKIGDAAPPAPAPEPDRAAEAELQRLRAQVKDLTGALEDVVAQALSGADYKERVMLMHRRAVAALSELKGK